MAAVNRELNSEHVEGQDPAEFAAGVGRLFGQSPRVLVNAVQRFLARTPSPGSLDHHLLRIVAAATPHINDPQLVAEMVDKLPVTGMSLSAYRLDLEWAGGIFGNTFPPYRPRTRQRLVADLVDRTVRDVVLAAPADRLTPEAREMAVGYLLEMARGRAGAARLAVNSPHATSEVISVALDTVESRIAKSEQQAAAGKGELLHLGTVGSLLSDVIDRTNDASSGRDAIRALRLALRCQSAPIPMDKVLDKAVRNDAVVAAEGGRLLDAINRSSGEMSPLTLRGTLVASPALDEELAHRAVREGVRQSDFPNVRLTALRTHAHAKQEVFDPAIMSSVDLSNIDRAVARLPLEFLSIFVISEIASPSALRSLARRVAKMDDSQIRSLVGNSNLDLTTARRVSDRYIVEEDLSPDETRTLRLTLLERDDLTDRSLIELIGSAQNDDEREILFGRAASHPAASVEFVRQAMAEPDSNRILVRVAANSKSPEIHRMIFDHASRGGQLDVLQALWQNGTLDGELAHRTEMALAPVPSASLTSPEVDLDVYRRRDPSTEDWGVDAYDGDVYDEHDDLMPPTYEDEYDGTRPTDLPMRSAGLHRTANGLTAYGPADLAENVIRGTARPGVIDALVRSALDGSSVDHDALLALADAGKLDVDHWIELTSDKRPISALRYATHPNCPGFGNGFTTAAERLLHDTDYGLRLAVGEFPTDSKARTWEALPSSKDELLTRHIYSSMFDGQIVDGEPLVTPKSQRDLDNIADVMGNCLRDYEPKLRSRQSLVAWSHHGSRTFAVAWNIVGKTVSVEQIDAEYNSGGVPESFIEGIRDLTDKFNRGELRRVEKQVEVSNDVSRDVQSEDPPTRRVRPGRRDPLRLASSAEEQRDLGHDQTPPPPSLLAGRSGENDLATNGVEDVADAHDVQQEQVPGPTNVERDHGVDI